VACNGALKNGEDQKRSRKNEKAALSQGGFFDERGCENQRHEPHYA
jgi:hypothetical protein